MNDKTGYWMARTVKDELNRHPRFAHMSESLFQSIAREREPSKEIRLNRNDNG